MVTYVSLKRRLPRCRITDEKFPTVKKKSKCRSCDREVSKIRHDSRRIFGQNVVVLGLSTLLVGLQDPYYSTKKNDVNLAHSYTFDKWACQKL